MLTRQTEVPHNDENLRQQNSLDNDEGIGISIEQISALITAEQFACTLKNIENENGMNGKALDVICENSVISTLMLITSDSQHDFMFVRNNQRSYDEDIEEDKMMLRMKIQEYQRYIL